MGHECQPLTDNDDVLSYLLSPLPRVQHFLGRPTQRRPWPGAFVTGTMRGKMYIGFIIHYKLLLSLLNPPNIMQLQAELHPQVAK